MKQVCENCKWWDGRHPDTAVSVSDVERVESYAECKLFREDTEHKTKACSDYVAIKGVDADVVLPKAEIVSREILGGKNDCEESAASIKEQSEANVLRVVVSVAPDAEEYPLRYRIRDISCEALPFLKNELLSGLMSRSEPESSKTKLCFYAECAIKEFLKVFGFAAAISVEMAMDIVEEDTVGFVEGSKNGQKKLSQGSTSKRRGIYKGRNVKKATYPEDKRINIYVDLGSTNSKYIVAAADANGKSTGFLEIPVAEKTSRLCGGCGISYDKASAYKLGHDEFISWLAYAVLGFMRKIQEKFKSNVVNIYWAFPKVVEGAEIDFAGVSKVVTNRLCEYGLLGRFCLIPEGESLKWMFKDRVTELAAASEEEERTNKRREEEEARNRTHNENERRKVEASRFARDREAAAWKKDHWFKKWFCSPEVTTRLYDAQIKSESLGRETLLKEFRKTGASGDGRFSMLILDAGGSTLDFCFLPVDGSIQSDSYQAGGAAVTDGLAKKLSISFEDAEKRKQALSVLSRHEILREITEAVYQKALKDISSRVGDCKPLCVIGTGLAMANRQLRLYIKEVLRLPPDQIIMYSPDIASLFPDELLGVYPKFVDFLDIVHRVVKGSNKSAWLPWSGGDVCGGMYFRSIDEE